jgi:hypothetical protein
MAKSSPMRTVIDHAKHVPDQQPFPVDKPADHGGNNAVISMARKKNALNLCLTVITSRIIPGSFSRGNAGRDGDLWGGTGASVLPPT